MPVLMEPSSNFILQTIPCHNGSDPEDCAFVVEVTEMVSNQPFVVFDVFQNILIYTALAGGFICLLYLSAVRPSSCKNWGLLFVTILTGFLHMLLCVYLLQMAQFWSKSVLSPSGAQDCTDYFLPATVANAIVLLGISLSVVSQWSNSRVMKLVTTAALVLGTVLGLCLITDTDVTPDSTDMADNTLLSFGGDDNSTRIDIFWSICARDIAIDSVLYEYILMYAPFITVIAGAWYVSAKENKDWSLLKIRIVRSPCVEGDVHCTCRKLNLAFVAVVCYTALILFIARPAQIIYSFATSGSIRDILPSLLQSVIFCFLCTECIIMLLKSRINSKRSIQSPTKQLLVDV